ncbi:MAG: glycosyltransferase family 39 protein, partial [Bacteroidetes bacterium]|nr:glycosyltransferase family 39 protein [Bacteroidota bacterium]
LAISISFAFFWAIRSDEAYTMHTTSGDLSLAIDRAWGFENQPPVYFALLSIWRDIHPSLFFARFFSIICIALTTLFIPGLIRRYAPGTKLWLVLLLFLFNPYTIYIAIDARTYALMILMGVIAMIFFHDGFIKENPQIQTKLMYALLGLLGLMTHYYFAFLFVANGLVLLLTRPWKETLSYGLYMLIPVAGLILIIPELSGQVNSTSSGEGYQGSFLQTGKFVLKMIDEHFTLGKIPFIHFFRLAIIGILSLVISRDFRKIIKNTGKEASPLLIILITLFMTFAMIHWLLGPLFVELKYRYLLLLPMVLLVGYILSLSGEKWPYLLFIPVILLVYGLGFNYRFSPFYKVEDYKGISAFIETHESNNQPIMVYNAVEAMVLPFHYHGKNEIYSIPVPIDFDQRWDHQKWILRSEEQVQKVFESVPTPIDTVWFLSNGKESYGNISYNRHYLENYIRHNYTVIDSQKFEKRMTLQLLKKKKQNIDHIPYQKPD